jgi:hypothetical protein
LDILAIQLFASGRAECYDRPWSAEAEKAETGIEVGSQKLFGFCSCSLVDGRQARQGWPFVPIGDRVIQILGRQGHSCSNGSSWTTTAWQLLLGLYHIDTTCRKSKRSKFEVREE